MNELIQYIIGGGLARDVSGRLNGMARNAWTHPFYSPDGWFYEGTVRALVFDLLEAWIAANAREPIALLAEQPYPGLRWRVDVAAVDGRGRMVLIEIKADFDLDSVEEDLPKVEQAVGSLEGAVAGFVLYCVDQDRADAWAERIRPYESQKVRGSGIVRMPARVAAGT